MLQNKKQPVVAVIREAECIGCTKCIAACPADAILGSAKHMHTVILNECIGCTLCVAPCPVDCIDIIPAPFEVDALSRAAHFKKRYHARKKRLEKKSVEALATSVDDKKSYIQAALQRMQKN